MCSPDTLTSQGYSLSLPDHHYLPTSAVNRRDVLSMKQKWLPNLQSSPWSGAAETRA